MIHRGGCHCGHVRFEVEAPPQVTCRECNCSICSMSGYLHLIVPKSKFKLLSDASGLACYSFNTGVAKHFFCRNCGVKSFYIPRSNPDGYDINVRCLSPAPEALIIEPFDGRNWEQHAHEVAHLSKES